jgi:hypothetical protein
MEKTNLENRGIFTLGAVTAIIALIGIILDIIIGIKTGGNLSALPQTAADRYLQFNGNVLMGLYHLDLLNVIIQILLIPVWFALFVAHITHYRYWAMLALLLFLFGSALMVADNIAFPMYELSKKYVLADNETQKSLYDAAGEAMLARGAHGSTGMFFSFLIPNIAGFLMSLVMLKSNIFSRLNAWSGILGYLMMMLYVILVTFISGAGKSAVFLALPGGILILIWLIMVTAQFFKLRTKS